MSERDGGSAFPHPEIHDQHEPFRHLVAAQGMSLRDYFAVHADLSKFEAHTQDAAEKIAGRPCPEEGALEQLEWQADLVANVRYAMADAMLKARSA